MRKVKQLNCLKPYWVQCVFDNDEVRYLNLHDVLDKENKYAKVIFDPAIFKQAKVGFLGEIYWENIGEITTLTGEKQPCAYDIDPDLVYSLSVTSADMSKVSI